MHEKRHLEASYVFIRAIKVDANDNVAVVVDDAHSGDTVGAGENEVIAVQDIPRGHKVAISEIAAGELIVKYGVPIGRATKQVLAGEHVHVHNIKDVTGELCEQYRRQAVAEREGWGP